MRTAHSARTSAEATLSRLQYSGRTPILSPRQRPARGSILVKVRKRRNKLLLRCFRAGRAAHCRSLDAFGALGRHGHDDGSPCESAKGNDLQRQHRARQPYHRRHSRRLQQPRHDDRRTQKQASTPPEPVTCQPARPPLGVLRRARHPQHRQPAPQKHHHKPARLVKAPEVAPARLRDECDGRPSPGQRRQSARSLQHPVEAEPARPWPRGRRHAPRESRDQSPDRKQHAPRQEHQ
mmetsp:Transcript_19027/g.72707  ORF Transcript_19027/g.72707 Transcript_19027/m.72707 type:complete len:236 (-) Transcript_19027:316-1023(-)